MIPISITLLILGFLLGIKHAFDVDHITAISTIITESKSIKKSSLLGIFWGVGHTITLLIVGLAILTLKITIPDRIALSLESVVGIMLVILGVNIIRKIKKNKIHIHRHQHDTTEHIHLHSHKLASTHEHQHLPYKRSLFIGVIHGLAGSASLSILVLTTINSILVGLLYILLFGIGSIIGMSLISIVLYLPFRFLTNKFNTLKGFLEFGTGITSVLIGISIIHNIL